MRLTLSKSIQVEWTSKTLHLSDFLHISETKEQSSTLLLLSLKSAAAASLWSGREGTGHQALKTNKLFKRSEVSLRVTVSVHPINRCLNLCLCHPGLVCLQMTMAALVCPHGQGFRGTTLRSQIGWCFPSCWHYIC